MRSNRVQARVMPSILRRLAKARWLDLPQLDDRGSALSVGHYV